jgi:hypothetical protein
MGLQGQEVLGWISWTTKGHRLVARGFSQQYGVDYMHTFAPTVRLTSNRLVLAFAAMENLI